jgi:hypothetical protein
VNQGTDIIALSINHALIGGKIQLFPVEIQDPFLDLVTKFGRIQLSRLVMQLIPGIDRKFDRGAIPGSDPESDCYIRSGMKLVLGLVPGLISISRSKLSSPI